MYKILVIEDEKLIRKRIVYGHDYESMGCIVVGEARDGKEGVKCIKQLNPDIIITDINMPVMDAFDMLEETMEYVYSTIILSAYNEFENAQKAIKYGVTEFIVKPIETNELKDAVERAIYQVKINNENKLIKDRRQSLRDSSLIQLGNNERNDEVVEGMIKYIKDNYGRKFVFSDVATQIGYSQSLLHNRFKKHTKMTFNEYLNRYRIKQSIDQLKKDEKKVYEIASDCGFSEYKYFNKVFKKYVGMSATKFKEKL